MLPGTSKGSKRYTVLHVSFSNRFWVSILDPPHRVYRLRPNFSELKVTLPATEVAGQVMSPATINYGNFLQTLLNFIIITFCVFLMVKMIMRLSKSKENEASVAPEPSNEEKLLAEIRDLMKERKQ